MKLSKKKETRQREQAEQNEVAQVAEVTNPLEFSSSDLAGLGNYSVLHS